MAVDAGLVAVAVAGGGLEHRDADFGGADHVGAGDALGFVGVATVQGLEPVWSKAISAQGTSKAAAGSVNVPVVCAGAAVRPGDIIVADVDGVVVVPRETAPVVVERASARVDKEQKSREQLKAGTLGIDMYGLRARLRELGVRYVDTLD